MIWPFRAKPVSTGPIAIPDDLEEAREIKVKAEKSTTETKQASRAQQSWFERTVAPTLEDLRVRREQNGFGQEFELSILPRERG